MNTRKYENSIDSLFERFVGLANGDAFIEVEDHSYKLNIKLGVKPRRLAEPLSE